MKVLAQCNNPKKFNKNKVQKYETIRQTSISHPEKRITDIQSSQYTVRIRKTDDASTSTGGARRQLPTHIFLTDSDDDQSLPVYN